MHVAHATADPPARPFRVREVELPGSRRSWTLIGPGGEVVEAVERFLAFLTHIERSPNTVRAYALDLCAYFTFLDRRGIHWERVGVEDLAEFTSSLRQPAPNVVVLDGARPARKTSTVNRKLSAVFSFYDYHQRNGVEVLDVLTARGRSGQGSYRPFLHGIARTTPRRVVRLAAADQRVPKTLTLTQVRAVITAQTRLRNELLFRWMFETGARIGQLLGLRHEDIFSQERRIYITPRDDNANGARGKGGEGSIFVTKESVRLYADYMHEEYGDLDSDYVFVNLWGGRIGSPMTYRQVDDVVRATRRKVGFHFTPHMFRHTFATLALREGVPLDVVSRLITHGSVSTTNDVYVHPDPQHLRDALRAAGLLDKLGDLV